MSINVCELPCEYRNTGVDEIFRSLITTDDNGCFTVRSEATNADTSSCDGLPCSDAMMSWQEIFKKLVFIDGDGCLALRIVTVTEA